jgi:hypothetical protein
MRQAAEMQKTIQRSLGFIDDGQRRRVEALVRSVEANYTSLVKPTLEVLRKAHEAWKASLPSNWHELRAEELTRTLELIEQAGLCLVWTPRVEVIRQILESEDREGQLRALELGGTEVLEDLETALGEARGTEIIGHADACDFAADALAAERDGHSPAAQALTAAGLGPIVHGAFGFEQLGGAYKRFSKTDMEEATLRLMKMSLLQLCTARALTDTDRVAGPGFYRHPTQHGERSFFTPANSLAGLLLLVGWVRELKWLSEKHPELFRELPAFPDRSYGKPAIRWTTATPPPGAISASNGIRINQLSISTDQRLKSGPCSRSNFMPLAPLRG